MCQRIKINFFLSTKISPIRYGKISNVWLLSPTIKQRHLNQIMKALPLIIFAMFLNAGAQLLLKAGMNRIGFFAFSWANFVPVSLQIIGNPYIALGILTYIVSLATWLLVLSRIDVGIAYPLTSLAYILTALAAYYIFDEHLSMVRILGIGVILIGVYMVART